MGNLQLVERGAELVKEISGWVIGLHRGLRLEGDPLLCLVTSLGLKSVFLSHLNLLTLGSPGGTSDLILGRDESSGQQQIRRTGMELVGNLHDCRVA